MKFEAKVWQVVLVGCVLLVLWLVNLAYALFSKQAGGTLGDTFGVVNALFSGSALFFLVLTFLTQRQELNVVREERNDTKKLLQGQEEINRLQKNALDRQVFEQSFHSALDLLSDQHERLSEPAFSGGSINSRRSYGAQKSSQILEKFGADPSSLQEFRFKLDGSAPYVVSFLETLFLAHSLVEEIGGATEEFRGHSNILKSFNSEDISICALAYLVCSTLENRSIDYQSKLVSSHLDEFLPEGFQDFEEYFACANAIATQTN